MEKLLNIIAVTSGGANLLIYENCLIRISGRQIMTIKNGELCAKCGYANFQKENITAPGYPELTTTINVILKNYIFRNNFSSLFI